MKVKDMVDEVVSEVIDVTDDEINSTHPEWIDKVLDELSDHELIAGAPTTDGLRRVAEKLFGEILESDTEIVSVDPERVVAKHCLVISKYKGGVVRVSACVDVFKSTLPSPFNNHVVASACTRAEGKALRRALKIRAYTAEETYMQDEADVTADTKISDQQSMAIQFLCKRTNTNLKKLVKHVMPNAKSLDDVKNKDARMVINRLSEFQRKETPKEFVGYDPNWKENFKES